MSDNQEEKIMDWPWNPEKEKLTESILMEIAKNLPWYASDAIDSCSRTNDERDLLGYFFVYCHVVKEEYFEAIVKNLKGSVREEARKLAGEAFDLIDLLEKWVNTRCKSINCYPSNIFARWDTVVRKFNLCMSDVSQRQEQSGLTDTEQNMLEALANDTLHGPELLRRAGYDNSSHFRTILSNLVKRGILGKNQNGYYRQ